MTERSKRPTLREGGPRESIEDARTEVWDTGKLQPVPREATQVRSISKKTPGVAASRRPPHDTPPRAVPQVKLRAMSDVQSGPHASPQPLGYLAPPRDPSEVRARRWGDLVMWASVCVMIACGVALGIWFLAR
jgi:hypothetical protein